MVFMSWQLQGEFSNYYFETPLISLASSRPDLIDPALLRPGRLDKSLLCDMPSESDRLDILQACSKKLDLDADVDLAFLASRTDGFSGADLQSLIYNAHLDAVHEVLEKKRDVRTDAGEETNAVQFMSTSQNDGSLTAAAKSEFSNRVSLALLVSSLH